MYAKSSLLKLTNFNYKKNEDHSLNTIHYLLFRVPFVWLNLFSCFQCCGFRTVKREVIFHLGGVFL